MIVTELAVPETAQGDHVRLGTVEPQHIPFLYRLVVEDQTGWRYRGATPDPQVFAAQLWDGVLAQFLVQRVADSRPIGLVCAYNANLGDGYAYAAGVCDNAFLTTGLGVEALLLLAEHVFSNWNMRKLYFEVPAFNYPQFASGAEVFFDVEARLKDHTFYQGRYWDLVVGSLTREGLQQVNAARDRRRVTGRGDELMDLPLFCATMADALGLDPATVRPECHLVDDLGVDSIGALVLQDVMERDAGVTEFDLSEGLGTVRDAHLLYLSAASAPLLHALSGRGARGPDD